MKANELMIGDWVYSAFTISELPCKITCLKLHEGEYTSIETTNVIGVTDIASLSPIPLTTEILEKNGFVTNDEQGNWKGYRIYSIFDANKNCTFMLKLYEKDSIYEISLDMAPYYITFKYVHQLQHALRLCGIKKEIEL